jgi:hypothetical protein
VCVAPTLPTATRHDAGAAAAPLAQPQLRGAFDRHTCSSPGIAPDSAFSLVVSPEPVRPLTRHGGPRNLKVRGEVTIRQPVRNAPRMRPDPMVVGTARRRRPIERPISARYPGLPAAQTLDCGRAADLGNGYYQFNSRSPSAYANSAIVEANRRLRPVQTLSQTSHDRRLREWARSKSEIPHGPRPSGSPGVRSLPNLCHRPAAPRS